LKSELRSLAVLPE